MKENALDLSKIKTYPLKTRRSKVSVKDFAREITADRKFTKFVEGLPDILGGRNFKSLVKNFFAAKRRGKPILWMFGAHVIKCGLSPVIIQLARKGWVSAIALNGAGMIHDFEIAYAGQTSEDVAENIKNGSFGMAEETGRIINQTISEGVKTGLGLGEAVGKKINELSCKYKGYSILSQAALSGIPVTVHAAIGTDIIYQHRYCDGAAIGEGSYRDFLKFASLISQIGDGGVVVNFGSAVILPEVFLKAVTIARNLGYKVENFTTANFDMIQQYRPLSNIVCRPVGDKGQGFNFAGQHELMIPLLAKALLSGKGAN